MSPHEVMSMYFKEWAFTASENSVQVHSACNVGYARKVMKEHGLENVRVTFVSDGRMRR
jgi:hypothetical protein